MPTLTVIRDELLRMLGKPFTDEQLDDIFMQFGVELDEIVEEPERFLESQGAVVQYKIDITANRSDLLCPEGFAAAMRAFLGLAGPTPICLTRPSITVTVDAPTTGTIRPYCIAAVVRNVTFTQRSYNAFIDHQDKLHHNVGRRRALVAIGTHDLAKLDASHITYAAEKPESILFTALNQESRMNGRDLFAALQQDKKLSEFLPLIDSSDLWPVIRDARGEVLSLPPIINSEYSKIDLTTKDVFIESTATDLAKANIALGVLVNGLRVHSATPVDVEPVHIVYAGDTCGQPLLYGALEQLTPNVDSRNMVVFVDYIRSISGIPEKAASASDLASLLSRMEISAEVSADRSALICSIPFFRQDIIAPIDIVESVTIAFGYNAIAERFCSLPSTSTIGGTLNEYKRAEFVRVEAACCGYTELLLFSLCSAEDEIFGEHAVHLANAKTSMFTRARSSLIPGLLRAASANQHRQLPLKLFECAEVVLDDHANHGNDTGAVARKAFGSLYGGVSDGFENIHGLLDQIAKRLGLEKRIRLEAHDTQLCVSGRRANILLDGKVIGWAGVLHPKTLVAYKVPMPCSALELYI